MSECDPAGFEEGYLFLKHADFAMMHVRNMIINPDCIFENGRLVGGTPFERLTSSQPLGISRILSEKWRLYNSIALWDLFTYGIVPIIYAISALAVITWFLTLFVLTSYTIKASKILRLLIMLALVYMLVVIIKCIVELHSQRKRGYFYGAELLDVLNLLKAINIIDVIVIFFLQLSQVQVIMRLFSRRADKRMAALVGVSAVTTTQVIWGVAHFYPFEDAREVEQMVMAFIYLVRIVISLCYLAVILVQFVVYARDIIANKQIWLLTMLTLIFLYSPVAMFVADVSNSFIYAMTEVFLVVTNVICVVLPWEWCNRLSLIMKRKEREGVLGRKIYDIRLNRLEGHDDVTSRRGELAKAMHWTFANVDIGQDENGDSKIGGWPEVKDSIKNLWKKPRPASDVEMVDMGGKTRLRNGGDRDESRSPNKHQNVYVYTKKTVLLD